MRKAVLKFIIFLSILIFGAILILNIILIIITLNISKLKPIVRILPVIDSIPIIKSLPMVVALPTIIIQPTLTPTPKIYKLIDHYEAPKIPNNPSYTLIFVGDSMTEALGVNFDALRKNLMRVYPKKVFGLFNYGYGSTNILSVEERLNHDTYYQGRNSPAILNRYLDVILIESFGNNPLSEFPLNQGLQKQTAALDLMMAELTDTHPNSLIIFLLI